VREKQDVREGPKHQERIRRGASGSEALAEISAVLSGRKRWAVVT
jgi:hypothetical protein